MNPKIWYAYLDILDGVQNLTPEFFNDPLFVDTCTMARKLGRKVNCRWGLNRLREEHDKWSREISNILLECEDEKMLTIDKIYLDFADFSGYNLLRTNRDLLREGMVQKHCVGTYISEVNYGRCGIYHVEGYTLELRWEKIYVTPTINGIRNGPAIKKERGLHIIQFRGLNNENAPLELSNRVQECVDKFNEVDKEMTMDDIRKEIIDVNQLIEDLPFQDF